MIDLTEQKSFQKRLNTIRTLSKNKLISKSDQTKLTLKEAGSGSFFEYQNQNYFIEALNRYEEMSDDFKTSQGYYITELTCLCLETGQTVHFEWEFDDELEISITTERYTFRNLKDDQGASIDGDDLDQIADDKDVIVINNEKFWYEDDWAAVYHKDGAEEKVFMYEFENESSTKFLTIEEWTESGRDQYHIYTSVPVTPEHINLISKGEQNG